MAWFLAQAGDKLYAVATDGTAAELTLPADVTLDLTKRLRAAILNRSLIVVYAPTRNLMVDLDGNVRSLVPQAPIFPPTLAGGSGTGLTGTYKVKYTYIIKDQYGRVISESPFSPESTVTVTNDSIAVSGIGISADTSRGLGRRLYRTVAGGDDVFFQWVDLDDNITTSIDSSTPDAGLELSATLNEDLGSPPGTMGATRMRLIVAWKNRVWGVSDEPGDGDGARYTAALQPWAWPSGNVFDIPKVGEDSTGITAFIPRRDDLGICKSGSVHKIVGEDDDTFQRVIVNEGEGLVAPDSVVVLRNVGYGLGSDGVYRYDDDGFTNISKERVHAWFTTDDYFNRALFDQAIGRWNPVLDTYELHLAAAGSSVLDRWISYDLKTGGWLGPHKTGLMTPTAAGDGLNASGSPITLVGGNNGFIYTLNRSTRTDGASTAIDFDVKTIHGVNTPDIEKVYEQLDVLSKVQASGQLTLTPYLGGLDASAGTDFTADLTLGRERLVYLGPGRLLQLRWRQNVDAIDLTLYGAELPYFELGRK